MLKIGIFISSFLFLLLLHPQVASAAKTPRCTVANPGSTPVITDITSKGSSVTITWFESIDPVTHYLLAFGPSKTQLIYGSPNIGSKGTTSYTIDHLEVGKRYYFNIKAINECEPGDFSNTVSIIVGAKPDDTLQKLPNLSLYKSVLSASTSAKKNKHTTAAGVLLTSPYCSSCFGLPLLLLQTGTVLSYLFLSHKLTFFRQLYAVIIPIIFYVLFSFFANNCSPNMFFCKYYLQLSLISFIGVIIMYKYKVLHKKTEHREELLIKPQTI